VVHVARHSAPLSYRRFVDHCRHQPAEASIAEARWLAPQLAADPALRGWVPAVVLRAGALLAGRESFVEARQFLREGLEMLPGSAAERELAGGGDAAITLVGVLLVTGDLTEAWNHAGWLTEPHHNVETRLAGTRAQAAIRNAFGDSEIAFHLINTASGLALQCRSRLRSAVVETDRAMVLASVGRVGEAVHLVDEVLPRLGVRVPGPLGVVATSQAAAAAAAVGIAAANAGDVATARRLAEAAVTAADASGRSLARGEADLAVAAAARAGGMLRTAEQSAFDARQRLAELGAVPLAAAALRERAAIAWYGGSTQAAADLAAQAVRELEPTGYRVELAATRRFLDHVAAAR